MVLLRMEVKEFHFKLRVFRSLLPPTIMSGINPGDEVSCSSLGLRVCCLVADNFEVETHFRVLRGCLCSFNFR